MEEFYYMIDGRRRVTLDKETVETGPGDAVPVR
jgi:mannose-6-phosphate isomerase-like protein (cupin superfamily)